MAGPCPRLRVSHQPARCPFLLLLLPVAGAETGPRTHAATALRIASEEPGTVGFTPGAVAAAGCARPWLWEVPPSDFARALAEPGFVEVHAAPCLCAVPDATSAAPGTAAAVPELPEPAAMRFCLPDHPWFARGGSGYLAEGNAAAAAFYAAAQPRVAEVLGPALVCAGLLAIVTRLLMYGGDAEAELMSAAGCIVRPDGSLCLGDGGPASAVQAILEALHSQWAGCLEEALHILGLLACKSSLWTGIWPHRRATGSAVAEQKSCRTKISRAVSRIRLSPHDDWRQWAVRVVCRPANATGEACAPGADGGALRRVLDVAVSTAASRLPKAGSHEPASLDRRGAELELCGQQGDGGHGLSLPHHVQLGGDLGPSAHVLAASVVPSAHTAGGSVLELLLFVDGGAAGEARCLVAFSVGACRSLPRFPLLAWRCRFALPTQDGGLETAAAAASHYGTEVLLRCPLPAAVARHAEGIRGRQSHPLVEVHLVSETDPAWSAATPVPLCPVRAPQLPASRWSYAGGARSQWGLVGCSAPMWLARPEHGALVREWLAYHRLVGFERFVVYDLDGSLAEAVAPFEAEGFVEYVRRWPEKLSPGACAEVHRAAVPPGAEEPAWQRYCTQTQAESHCVWSLRGRARWAMLLHSFDAYAGSADGLRRGVGPAMRRLDALWETTAVVHLLRFDFGGPPLGSGPAPARFRWRQRAPLLLRGGRRGALGHDGSSAYDHPGALLVNPLHAWSVFTHWARGRPGSEHFTAPPELLRVNHYVDLLDEPRCAQAAANGRDPPCDLLDNSSAWVGAAALEPERSGPRGGGGSGARPGPPEPVGGAPGASGARSELLVVVPGHGRASRTATLLESLLRLRAEWGAALACLVFVYNDAPDFLGLREVQRLLTEPGCAVEMRPGTVFLEFLADAATRRALRRERPRLVLLLLDDIALGSARPVHAPAMAEIMARNRLDVASPALVGTHLSYDGMRPAAPRRRGAVGRLVSFIEWQAAFFTEEAFGVLCRMVRPALSKTWGYDELFPGAFLAELGRPPRMGVVDAMHVAHTGPWLAATTLREAEVEEQERALLGFYADSFNITPAPIRMRRGYLF